jgi:hypothetical protein
MSEKSEIQMTVDAPASTEQADTPKPFGGYNSVEDLIAAHAALVEKSGASATSEAGTEGSQPTTEAKPAAESEQPGLEIQTDAAAQETVTKAGLDWDGLNSEYAEHGKLTDETYNKLADGGIPREAVDTYIRGKQAEVDAYETAVFGTAGSAENYSSLLTFAKDAYTDTEKKAFNEAVTSGDVARAQLAVEALKARFESKRGAPPKQMLAGQGGGAGAQGYKSRAEMTTDMRNPKYKSDPAFRDSVLERLRNSQFK